MWAEILREHRFPQLLKPSVANVGLYLFFRGNKSRCFSHGNAKNLLWGNWECMDLFFLQLVIWDFYLLPLLYPPKNAFLCISGAILIPIWCILIRVTDYYFHWLDLCFSLLNVGWKSLNMVSKNLMKKKEIKVLTSSKFRLEVYTFS